MGKEESKKPKLVVIDKRKLQPNKQEETNTDETKKIKEEVKKGNLTEEHLKLSEKTGPEILKRLGKHIPPIKKTLTEQLAERKVKKLATKQERSNKIGCPNCKYMGIRDKFLFNPQLHAMICPACGVFFMESRLRQKVMEDIKRKQESGIIVPK